MSAPDRDIVLVTVDSWRTDTLDRMARLRDLTEGDERTTAVSQSAATHGAFPAILASRHSVQTYDREGMVKADVDPLPAVLRRHGYTTGAVLGSNPFLTAWERYFDRFWNDGMTTDEVSSRRRYSKLDLASRIARLRKRCPATEMADRARAWYREQSGPRFLWVHLMDIHGPYFPGLRRGARLGLLQTYATLYRYHVAGDRSKETIGTLRDLYDACVDRLDAQFPEILEFVDDDALVVITGDHGEEFYHGVHGHARLYDECVTTPFFARGLGHPVEDAPVRHLDLAPTILDELGVDPPDGWMGEPFDGTTRPAFLSNHAPAHDRTYVGLRTERYKFIKSFHDERWTVEGRELYDLAADPDEQTPVENDAAERLEARVDRFLDRPDADLAVIRETRSGIDDQVQDRLRELGYAE